VLSGAPLPESVADPSVAVPFAGFSTAVSLVAVSASFVEMLGSLATAFGDPIAIPVRHSAVSVAVQVLFVHLAAFTVAFSHGVAYPVAAVMAVVVSALPLSLED
jgi:hypothetical protein